MHQALETAGLAHELGRPVPGDVLPPKAQLVAAVLTVLERDPKRKKAIDPARVEVLVQQLFFDVEPWPFAGLNRPTRPSP